MRGRPARPPCLARWLAASLASRADRECLLGDLEEEFRRDVSRKGRATARRDYWKQVLRSIGPLVTSHAARAAYGRRTSQPEARGDGMLGDLTRDLRYAARTLAQRRGFTTVVVLTLCLGIGANVAIFSVVHGVLLQPLPYDDPARLVQLWTSSTRGTFLRGSVTGPDYAAWVERNRAFDALAAYTTQRFLYTGDGEPTRYTLAGITTNLFEVLGVAPALGRGFTVDEQRMDTADVVVLSHGFWQTRLGGAPDVLGRTLEIGGRSRTVVGIMPAGFAFPHDGVQVWAPLPLDHPVLQQPGEHLLEGLGRLRPDVTLATARTDMDRIAVELRAEHPDTHERRGVFVSPLRDEVVGAIEPTLWILQGAVVFVLLLACVNVANLLLARAVERRREMAVRVALGAGRRRLLQLLLTEGLLLSGLGGLAGLALAVWGTPLLLRLNPTPLPRQDLVTIDGPVLLFAAALVAVAGAVFGLVPAWRGLRRDPLRAIRSGGRGTVTGGRRLGQHATIALECGLALVLLIGAGLLVSSFLRLRQVDPGFESHGVLALQLALPDARYPDNATQVAFVEQALARIESLGGVESAAVVSHLPFEGDYWRYGFARANRPDEAGGDERPSAAYRLVSNGYFRTMQLPLLEGRTFTSRDVANAPRVIVVNETMARRFFPGESPLGQRVTFAACDDAPCEIVGVVGDVKHFGLEGAEDPAMYGAYEQKPHEWMSEQHFVVRTAGDPLALVAAVKAQVRTLDPLLAFDRVGTLADKLDRSLAPKRFLATLLTLFAATALLLAAVGIYGVIACAVGRRRQEIGVRMALGAHAGDVLRHVVGQGMRGAAIGLAAGLLVALGLTRFLRSVLYAVEPTDPATFAAVTALLVAVALLACWLPARRATRIDVLDALHDD